MAQKFQKQRRNRKPLQRELQERKVFVISIAIAFVALTMALLSARSNTSLRVLPGTSASR